MQDIPPEELANMKKWVETWKRAGPELERIREEEVRKADTLKSFNAFRELTKIAVQRNPPEPYSGLVELNYWLQLLEKKRAEHG